MNRRSHWWSGWPGAFCMFCHAPDNAEQCLADDCMGWAVCAECGVPRPNPTCDAETGGHVGFTPCAKHPETPCPVQGEQRLAAARHLHLPEDV